MRHSSAPFPLRVEELAHEIPGARLVIAGAPDARITGVHHDSRRIEPGDLFVARAGAQADGARFVAEALARGARRARVARRPGGGRGRRQDRGRRRPHRVLVRRGRRLRAPHLRPRGRRRHRHQRQDDHGAPRPGGDRRVRRPLRDHRHARRALRRSRSAADADHPRRRRAHPASPPPCARAAPSTW